MIGMGIYVLCVADDLCQLRRLGVRHAASVDV
jgi:hypothetical protein